MLTRSRLDNYLATATERASELNGEIIVFGSGGARHVPDGFSRKRAHDQILEFLETAANYAREHGLVIAIEPLNRSETNVINSIAEAVQFADELRRPEVQVLVDFYHQMLEGEGFDEIVHAGERIAHVHVADTDRLYPGSGKYDYQLFARSLLMPDTTNGSLWNATLGILIRKCLNRFSFCTRYSTAGQ